MGTQKLSVKFMESQMGEWGEVASSIFCGISYLKGKTRDGGRKFKILLNLKASLFHESKLKEVMSVS